MSWTLFLGVGVSLFALLFIGKTKNQAISWYDLGLFSFQPSEFIKVISIIWMAEYYEKNKDNLSSYWASLFPLFTRDNFSLNTLPFMGSEKLFF